MGLEILESDKDPDKKIEELIKLMKISCDNIRVDDKIPHLIREFTAIDAKAPTGDITTNTPWPKALRVFAEKILGDVSGVNNDDKILALELYLKELKVGGENVSSIQKIRQTFDTVINNSTIQSAGAFLKKVSDAKLGSDGKKDISSIKAFDEVALAAAAAASPAAAAASAAPAGVAALGADGAGAGGAAPAAGDAHAAPAPAPAPAAGDAHAAAAPAHQIRSGPHVDAPKRSTAALGADGAGAGVAGGVAGGR